MYDSFIVTIVEVLTLAVIAGLILFSRRRRKRVKMHDNGLQAFEIGDTERSRAFFARNPHYPGALERLVVLSNRCFGRGPAPKGQFENICFWLGHACRQDFVEIVFLGVHGYGGGATKLLRSLYERAVTIEHLIQNPEKVGKFVRFAAIQEHRALEAALRAGISGSDIDRQVGPPNTVAEIRGRFETHKAEFKAIECGTCGLKAPATWDLDFSSMVRKVGEPFNKLFLLANNNPNFLIHATLASATPHDELREQADAKLAIIIATDLLLAVIRSQSTLFSLGLDPDIERCGQDLINAQAEDLQRRK